MPLSQLRNAFLHKFPLPSRSRRLLRNSPSPSLGVSETIYHNWRTDTLDPRNNVALDYLGRDVSNESLLRNLTWSY